MRAQNAQVSAGQIGGLPAVAGQTLNATIIGPTRLTRPEEFAEALRSARSEARGAFGDDTVLLERAILERLQSRRQELEQRAREVEIRESLLKAAEKRIYPAIDVDASSTRHEELLFERTQLQQVWKLRRVLSGLAAEGNTGAGLELLIDRMRKFPNNEVFLSEIAKAPGVPS